MERSGVDKNKKEKKISGQRRTVRPYRIKNMQKVCREYDFLVKLKKSCHTKRIQQGKKNKKKIHFLLNLVMRFFFCLIKRKINN